MPFDIPYSTTISSLVLPHRNPPANWPRLSHEMPAPYPTPATCKAAAGSYPPLQYKNPAIASAPQSPADANRDIPAPASRSAYKPSAEKSRPIPPTHPSAPASTFPKRRSPARASASVAIHDTPSAPDQSAEKYPA